MASNRFITQAEAAEAMQQPAEAQARHALHHQRREPYLFDYVQEQLIERYGVRAWCAAAACASTPRSTRRCRTWRARRSPASLRPERPGSAHRHDRPVERLHPRDGLEQRRYQDRTFNLAAQGHRQPGSAFKTFVLTAAIRAGVDPNRTTYVSKPLNIDDPELRVYDWEVKTYGHTYSGTMTSRARRSRRTTRSTRS